MFNPRDIIDLIAANVRRSRNPFGAPASRLNTWWRQAGGFTRRPGDALLFTGLMYQAIPYIDATTRIPGAPGGQPLGGLSAVRPLSPRVARGLGIILPDLRGGKAEI